jgi:TIR domain
MAGAMSRRRAGPARGSGGGEAPQGHAFLSYVREDSRRVDQLQQALEAAGIPVWRDTADLWPGEDWRARIRQAITDNALVFIACFSRASLGRHRSYQNEELLLAIEQLRLRWPDDPWLIPVRLDECEIPDLDIGGGRTLASIQRVDLFASRSGQEIARLIAAVLRILGRSPAATSASRAPARATGRHEPRKRSWWRLVRARPRGAAAVPLIIAALLATGAYLVPQIGHGHDGSLVTGSITCESGRPVVGVWIAASTGQSDSGLAHLGPPGSSGISYPIGARGTYSYRLPHGGTYAVHVGCGGNAQHWASSNYSPLLSDPTVSLRCDDPAPSPRGASRRGTCAVVPAP